MSKTGPKMAYMDVESSARKRFPWMTADDKKMLDELELHDPEAAREMENLIHAQRRSDAQHEEKFPPVDAEQRERATARRAAAPYQAGGGRRIPRLSPDT